MKTGLFYGIDITQDIDDAGCPRSRRFCETWDGINTPTSKGRPLLISGIPRSHKIGETWGTRLCSFVTDVLSPSFYPDRMTHGLYRIYGAQDLHFLTFSCYQRRPFFRNAVWCDLFLETLERVRRCYRLVVLGYVVMPEHVHLLVSEPQRENLSVAMQALKVGFVRRLRGDGNPGSHKNGETRGTRVFHSQQLPRQFWQERFYDFNVWSEEKRIEKLRYIHRNPVERGLVASPELWPWSSFRWYASREVPPVKINDTEILVMTVRTGLKSEGSFKG